jgi:hypothetical protein
VAWRGDLILLPASSGSGKTSLTARLVAAGCDYFSDEVVLIERGTGGVRLVPINLCVRSGGHEFLERYFPGLSERPVHHREDGVTVRPLSPIEALGRMMDNCVAIPRPLTLADATVLVEMAERLHCYELIGGDLDQAAEHVLGLCHHDNAARPPA